jgi:hypothetical protein
MNPVLLILPLLYALVLAGIVFVPGMVALALALATKTAAKPQGKEDASGCLAIFHGLSMSAGILFLAIACGFVGAGLLSVGLNMVLTVVALILYSVSPTAGADLDAGLFAFLYFGLLFLGFLGFFALGMSRLVRWLGPKDGSESQEGTGYPRANAFVRRG